MCFYAAAPRTDTSCTISALEQRIARALGYKEIGIEGFVRSERAAGSIVLYRVFAQYGDGDEGPRATGSSSRRTSLCACERRAGPTMGPKGFVYPGP
jgi:hypothetical protein